MMGLGYLKIAGAASVLALLVVAYMIQYVLTKSQGNEKMARISKAVQEGALAFLLREYRYVMATVLIIAVLIAIVGEMRPDLPLGWKTSIAFIIGAVASAMAGFLGMFIATRSNARTTEAARAGGVKAAIDVAVSGGSVMGLGVVGIATFLLVVVYKLFNGQAQIVNGYAMGASLVALFARSGGGIYTKGADMGADLVGKVEAGIPEDDPRNPAVIADNVGDNVGDVAGLGADLLESYVESIIASLAVASIITIKASASESMYVTSFPFLTAAVGIVASVIGVFYVKFFAKNDPQSALMWGTYVSAGLTIIGVLLLGYMIGTKFTLDGTSYQWWGPPIACILGIISGVIVGFTSEYFTSGKYKPVQKLAEEAQSGPAVAVVGGTSIGMLSTAIPTVVLALAVILAYKVGGMYGVALASLGMLATTGMVLSVDAYGPIADNAGGIAEMSGLDPSVRKITDNLDAVGNTTAAIGKGFAIGSAAFAAIGLLSAFMLSAKLDPSKVSLIDPKILAGCLIGGMIPFVFCSLLFGAVSKNAYAIIAEVRRQFKEIPGLKEGKEDVMPDSKKCVDIATQSAIKGMMVPGILAIVIPVVIGFGLGAPALAGFLVGAITTGVMLGIQMANSGGAMDNAKKYIEEGHFGGKGSEAHKAAVVGDTYGDPLKDTAGPSINILIKLMCVIALVLAPLFI
ncbi:MAG TPA: sodium-translocating pyrophosphatase [Candidatus Hydrogenedens sp.]|nr:sodium-translocating pyrophosphatase [Candidatus Hydrogenedens sp.]HOL19828.1 sodium-translocating pyrophosphatase [Candidatus Hydrogenedens sp.]HPP58619.1 sodium-translocating pyrophosphatase [Candidatus Hydrogenedens sp.]